MERIDGFPQAQPAEEAERSVSQGKISQAIRQYQEILNNDPADVSLLNTIGDLYIRDRNIPEGLKQFHKLAEAFVREGFNVKAIAIYRKISKVDSSSVEVLLKLAELYQLQGLAREAREQYLQATEFFKKRNQIDRALEVFRKLVQLDPENINFRNRLAVECEHAGKRDDAARAYLEAAEILLRRDDQVATETALKKAADMDPKNAKVQLLRARMAIGRREPEEAERIINATPELQSDPSAKRILLDSYLALRKIPEAERIVLEVFHTNPGDFEPVGALSALLVENGDTERAYELLAGVADSLVSQHNTGPLVQALRGVWNASPQHIPTLELIHRVCERSADELTLPEVLEALGHAYEETGDLEKAEAAYLKLVEREPENENFHGLLNAIQRKLGREIKPVDLSSKEMALAVDEPPPQSLPVVDANQEAMVKEAFENSDLFSRYNLTDKAIAELEKVLQFYPDQIEVHRRILEIARKNLPERAAAASAQLARIFSEQGDHEMASKYHAIASAKGPLHELPLPAPLPVKKLEEAAVPSPPPPDRLAATATEFAITPIAPEEPAAAPEAPPTAARSFDLTPPETPNEPPAFPSPLTASPAPREKTVELDLSGDLEAMAAFGFEAPPAAVVEQAAPPAVEPPAPEELPVSVEESAAVPVETPPADVPVEIPPTAIPEETPANVPVETAPAAFEEEAVTAPVEAPIVAEEPPPASVEAPPAAEEFAPAPMEVSVVAEEPPPASVEALPVVEEFAPAPTEASVIPEEPPWVPVEVPAPAEEAFFAPVEPPAPAEEPGFVHAETPDVAEEPVQPSVEPPQIAEEPQPAPVAEEPAPPRENEIEVPASLPAVEDEEEEIPVELEDSRIEVEFYLENGFMDEARQAVAGLEEKYPKHPLVAELRRRLIARASGAAPAEPLAEIVAPEETLAAELPAEVVHEEEPAVAETPAKAPQAEEPVVPEAAPVVAPPEPELAAHAPAAAVPEPEVEPPPVQARTAEEVAHEEWELPTSYAAVPEPAPTPEPVAPPREPAREAASSLAEFSAPPHGQEYIIEEPAAADSAGNDMLGDLAGELASSLEGMAESADVPQAPPAARPISAARPAAAPPQGAEHLSGLLAEMEEPGDAAAAAAKDDPETHYNLGVAFREMGLLDEAIGEFQKVVKGAGKGKFPDNFLQACSLLAICFMEKKMPAIAVKWYGRALETPGLDEEAAMALQYDLGLAYEQAGDSRNALERFTEVYSQNIDFRDVADKIRELQQKT